MNEPNKSFEADKPQTFVIKTETDAYINERLQTQPKTIDEVKLKGTSEVEPRNLLSLPKKVEQALKQRGLVPRWINKDKRMIDRALDIRGWTLFNRVYFPEIPKHFFTANGTVENGDSILGFMPADRAEILRSLPGKLSSERVKDLPMERFKESRGEEKIGYYKPAYTAEPEGEVVRKGVGLFSQPDLPTTDNE